LTIHDVQLSVTTRRLRRPDFTCDHTVTYTVSMKKYVVLYESADDVMSKAPAHFAEHSARGDAFHANGTLLMYGPFSNPQEEGSMAVFSTREAAQEFVNGDPFVLNGVVRRWQIREWDEAYT
jgi:uncharacterized protein